MASLQSLQGTVVLVVDMRIGPLAFFSALSKIDVNGIVGPIHKRNARRIVHQLSTTASQRDLFVPHAQRFTISCPIPRFAWGNRSHDLGICRRSRINSLLSVGI